MNDEERRAAIYRRAGYDAAQMRAASERTLDWEVAFIARNLDTELAMLLNGDGGNA